MARPSPAAIVLLLACLAAACESQAGDADFVQTDSAGVSIVESFLPSWEADARRLRAEPGRARPRLRYSPG